MAPKDRRSNTHGHSGSGPSREVVVSKALSWLLRHGAAKERIAMDEQGYVNVADLLRWHKLRVLKVELPELAEVVERNEKKRFGLLWVGGEEGARDGEAPAPASGSGSASAAGFADGEGVPETRRPGADTDADTVSDPVTAPPDPSLSSLSISPTPTPSPETQTAQALNHISHTPDPNPSHYLIRATQGHSLKTLSASQYLVPITPATAPSTCVHGTFYAAWPLILATGGLKPMTRVHVHFATGPRLEDVLPQMNGGDEGGEDRGGGGRGKEEIQTPVISGLRAGAQILIYVNLARALAAGVEFWRSENGVVLTEGVANANGTKMLGTEFWDVVVETKVGLGHLWRDKVGVVRDLPGELVARGGGRGGRGGGRGGGKGKGGGKPKLRVERDARDGDEGQGEAGTAG